MPAIGPVRKSPLAAIREYRRHRICMTMARPPAITNNETAETRAHLHSRRDEQTKASNSLVDMAGTRFRAEG